MPVVSRTTVTTTRTSGTGFRSSTVPLWAIKLITVIIATVVLILVYSIYNKSYYAKTYIIIGLTCGFLLGWSIGSVLQQVFFIRTVEILINVILSILAILCLVLVIAYLVEASRSTDQKYMIGIGACFLVQTVVCILMLSWAWYGNIVIIQSS